MTLCRATLAIPLYNEAESLPKCLESVSSFLSAEMTEITWDILLVNDGSSDATAQVVDEVRHGIDFPVRIIHHRSNRGLGAALESLFANAEGDVVVTLDADLSYAVGHIRSLVEAWTASDAAVVLASPYMNGGKTIGVPRALEVRSRAANLYLSRVTSSGLHTFTGMVRAYSGDFARGIRGLPSGPSANAAIVLDAWSRGLSIVEVPATLDWSGQARRRSRSQLMSRRSLDESSYTLKLGVQMRRALIRQSRRRAASPASAVKPLLGTDPMDD